MEMEDSQEDKVSQKKVQYLDFILCCMVIL